MRLIDADALKEAMEEHTDYKGYLVCDPEEIIDLAPTIEERPQWIPCSERLPEEYHTYLVTKLDPNPSKSTFTTLAYFYTEETGWDIDDVIAWMPFPKPYQKEGDMDG